jgi:hypothetical protein
MRHSNILALSTALASMMVLCAGGLSPADARIFLGQCISAQNACHRRCLLALNGQEANYSTLYGLKICLNNCDGGFSACLDIAFSSAAGKVDLSSGPSRNPPKIPAVRSHHK